MNLTAQLKKYIKSLHHHKYRQKYNKFIVEGPKISEEFLLGKHYSVEYLICEEEWMLNHLDLCSIYRDKLIRVDSKSLNSISALQNPNKILMVLESRDADELKFKENEWTIYLDRIQDPGNLGTIMRIADWYGVNSCIAGPGTVSYYNPKVVQSAMGAHNRINLCQAKFEDINCGSIPTLAMSLNGININTISVNSGIIIIGNESQGISSSILDSVTHCITIPKFGGAESLNASVACGIACHVLIAKD